VWSEVSEGVEVSESGWRGGGEVGVENMEKSGEE